MKSLLTAVLALAGTSTAALAELSDEQQVLNAINNVGYYADQGDWDMVAAQFHPDGAVLDYTSYANASAGTSADLPTLLPAQIVAAWQTVLPGYDRTHHLMGTESVSIQGDTATTTSNIHATHILENEGENTWVFIGDYQHELAKTDQGWKITFMRANLRAQLGNENLPALAAERVKAANN
ncbi:nuclear transport factor 2 family protein [Ruegeria sp. Ofav3-42]|uniref:nuclear transport factor 2 family protein n=1 Tax=Ruegeria sp. Ofav3-42 TaxID=2917759 RepID=UPI001EF64F67|nr:nuclear transport factor 2 family protein [Ruegeria sp. Ofav3-42]MCG7522476.1 nuclear transport factor 2 family protein [Ruegeria sp. Ofav3-42]